MKKYFKVKFGYQPIDYVSVDELGLQKAIYGMFAKKPIQIGETFIQGDKILSIVPHYNKYTGWNEFYEPKEAEDFLQIKRDCPDFEGYIESTKNYVAGLMQSGKVQEIGKQEIPQIENTPFDMIKALSESKRLN